MTGRPYRWLAAAVLPPLAGVGLWWLRTRLVAVTVTGDSMAPTLVSGDHVLVRRTPRLRPGAVVVVEKPGIDRRWHTPRPVRARDLADRRWIVKRAVAVAGDPVPPGSVPPPLAADARVPAGSLVLIGDNQRDSYDSRLIGYFPLTRVLGVVVRPLTRPAR